MQRTHDRQQLINEKKAVIAFAEKLPGKNLLRIRKSKNLKQQQVGDLLGVTYQQIQKIESGINKMSGGQLYELCKELRIPMESLFFQNGKSFLLQNNLPEEASINISISELMYELVAYPDQETQSFLIRHFRDALHEFKTKDHKIAKNNLNSKLADKFP